MKSLKISDDLILPPDAVTQTFGILAVRGAGKSNLGAVMAEEMFAAGLPFVVVDPVGAWWGVRSSGDGKAAGLSIPVFGGRHGDVPLERASGQMIADLVVKERLSCVLDVSDFSEGDKVRFLTDFAERLYRTNSQPLHLFLEEADDYVPQRPFHEQARLLRAWENIVRRGRSRGLGITMITQRSAALNKNVLTQIETLFVLRTTSPQDRKAIEAWVEYHGQAEEILESLPGLASGQAWVWSPFWLKKCEKVGIRRRWTFDSGATPKDVRAEKKPATLADVDLGSIKTLMAETIERAKAEDPRELRRKIADLEGQLLRAHMQAPVTQKAPTALRRVEVPVLTPSQVGRLEKVCAKLSALGGDISAHLKEFSRGTPAIVPPAPARTFTPPEVYAQAGPRPVRVYTPDGKAPGRCAQAVLRVLAQFPEGRSASQIAILTGYSVTSSGFSNTLSALRVQGLIEGQRDAIRITAGGREAVGPVEPLPMGPALVNHWVGKLGRAEASILMAVVHAGPNNGIFKEKVAEATGYSLTSSGFNNALSKLRVLELIEGRDPVTANPVLF